MTFVRRIVLLIGVPIILLSNDLSWNYGITSNLGRGDQQGETYDYSENYLSLSGQLGAWYLDLNLEYSSPPEYGYSLTGIQNILLRYTATAWTLEAGDLNAVFGRGLALQTYEDQTIDFDNRIRGLRLRSSLLGQHEINLLAGFNENYRFYSPSSELREPDGEAEYRMVGAETMINSSGGVWSLAPYIIASQMRSDYSRYNIDPELGIVRLDTLLQTQNAMQLGWSQAVYGSNWDIFLEYNRTWKAFDQPLVEQNIYQTGAGVALHNGLIEYEREGQALNLQLNWFPDWATIMFDYRRYLSGPELTSDKRNPLLLSQKALPWQLGPTGIRQHDISLLGNVTHPVDYGDELGWTLELTKYFGYSWSMVLNASQISRSRDSRDMSLEAGILPTNDIRQHPWSEYFAEFEYTGERLSQRMLVAFTQSVLSGMNSAEISDHITVVPAYFSWVINPNLVANGLIELQHSTVSGVSYDDEEQDGHEYGSYHLVGSIDYKSDYSFSVIWDASDDPLLNTGVEQMQHWVSGEVSAKPLDGLWIRASYGKEKGGVRCTGGVCRILNPFEGFRLTLEWRR